MLYCYIFVLPTSLDCQDVSMLASCFVMKNSLIQSTIIEHTSHTTHCDGCQGPNGEKTNINMAPYSMKPTLVGKPENQVTYK